MPLTNFTDIITPKISKYSKYCKNQIYSLPEMRLHNAVLKGDKGIIHVGMNECKASEILPGKIHTIYTDALAGCNSIVILTKGKNGCPIVIQSHYAPNDSSQVEQVQAIQRQLENYMPYFDFSVKPKVYYNVPGYINENCLKPCVNKIFDKMKPLFSKYFNKGYEENIILYQSRNRPAFFSSAHILQFDKSNPNKCLMTTAGQNEYSIYL